MNEETSVKKTSNIDRFRQQEKKIEFNSQKASYRKTMVSK